MYVYFFPVVLTLFSILYVIIGVISARNIKTNSEFFLADRNLGFFSVTLSLLATQLGGGTLLGTAQSAYSIGIYSIVYTISMSIGFLLLASGIAKRMQMAHVSTNAELFEKRYNSPTLKKVASLLSIAALCGLLVGQIVASRSVMIGFGLQNPLIFIGFWIFIIGYTMFGGLGAVVATDVFQVAYIILIFTAIFIYCVYQNPSSLLDIFSTKTIGIGPTASIPSLLTGMSKILVMPALFTLIEQDLAQRFFSSRTARIATLSALTSGICLVLFALIPVYFGVQAQRANLLLLEGASPLVPIIALLTNEYITALVVCGIAAAVTSTADSLLCAITSNLALDFSFSFLKIKKKIHISQLLTLIVGVGALIASYSVPNNIIMILVDSYELPVDCLLVPLLISYYRSNLNKWAAVVSMWCGFFGFVMIKLFAFPGPDFLIPLPLSLIGFIIGNQIPLNRAPKTSIS